MSGFAWAGGVPDPLVRGGVAFNLADLAIAGGDALLVVGCCVHAWTNRARLTQPLARVRLDQTLDEVMRRRRSAAACPHRSIASAAAPMPPSQRKKPIPRTRETTVPIKRNMGPRILREDGNAVR